MTEHKITEGSPSCYLHLPQPIFCKVYTKMALVVFKEIVYLYLYLPKHCNTFVCNYVYVDNLLYMYITLAFLLLIHVISNSFHFLYSFIYHIYKRFNILIKVRIS
ncbi:hypothetical protein CW304_15650 [Bacillus sp. UFRGS-B20]|nr:hypothetical protein CW304_15650 [Bacillus sp. UFRGS-B20]